MWIWIQIPEKYKWMIEYTTQNSQTNIAVGIEEAYFSRSFLLVTRSILERMLTWGNSSCIIAESDAIHPLMNLVTSVMNWKIIKNTKLRQWILKEKIGTYLWIKHVNNTDIEIFALQILHKFPKHRDMWEKFYLAYKASIYKEYEIHWHILS